MDEVVDELDGAPRVGGVERRAAAPRVRRARDEVEAIAVTALRRRWTGVVRPDRLDELAEQVVGGRADPYAAADRLLDER